MGSEQQFCLRWNNHQSTLISVFDTLLESETLVDVTLAAEGQYLKAHKVVLSACSQYFQELLCHHIEKHPIIILKDVTFQELKALIDYMYRGEVNVSQEQLSALIKTAESLKIKGLADGGDRRPDRKSVPQLSPPLPPVLAPALSGNLSLDGRSMGASAGEYATNSPLQHAPREGSISPVSRKRKRIRRRSGEGGGGHEADVGGSEQASSSASTISVPNIPATITPVNSGSRTTPGEGDDEEGASGSKGQEGGAEEAAGASSKQSKSEPGTSLQSHSQTPLLEPKSEYREEDEDDGEADEDSMDNVVALDEDVMDMEGSRDDGLDQKPGPSHGAEVSGQGSGFAPWHMMPDRSGDDIFIPSQDAAQRESQESLWEQPQTTSPMSLKIASVESGNISDWLGDEEPEDPPSSSQERGRNVAGPRYFIKSQGGLPLQGQCYLMRKSVANSIGYIDTPSHGAIGRIIVRAPMAVGNSSVTYPLSISQRVPGSRPPGRPRGPARGSRFLAANRLPVRFGLKPTRGRPRGSVRDRLMRAVSIVKTGDNEVETFSTQTTHSRGSSLVRRPRGRPRGSRKRTQSSGTVFSSTISNTQSSGIVCSSTISNTQSNGTVCSSTISNIQSSSGSNEKGNEASDQRLASQKRRLSCPKYICGSECFE